MSASEVMMAYSRMCRDLTDKEVEALVARGVHPDVIGWAGDEGHFKLRAWGKEIAIVCRDERGDVADIALWSPREGTNTLWFSNVSMIGQEACSRPRLAGDKLWVRANVLDWLVHRRTGVVIINYDAARTVLTACSPIAVKSRAHREQLDWAWRAPRIQVFEAGVAESATEAA